LSKYMASDVQLLTYVHRGKWTRTNIDIQMTNSEKCHRNLDVLQQRHTP